MIPRNTSYPCQRKHVFTTTKDNQTEFPIRIFEGDEAKSANNIFLGEFTFDGLPIEQAAGSVKLEVSFDIDGFRNLTATVYEP